MKTDCYERFPPASPWLRSGEPLPLLSSSSSGSAGQKPVREIIAGTCKFPKDTSNPTTTTTKWLLHAPPAACQSQTKPSLTLLRAGVELKGSQVEQVQRLGVLVCYSELLKTLSVIIPKCYYAARITQCSVQVLLCWILFSLFRLFQSQIFPRPDGDRCKVLNLLAM